MTCRPNSVKQIAAETSGISRTLSAETSQVSREMWKVLIGVTSDLKAITVRFVLWKLPRDSTFNRTSKPGLFGLALSYGIADITTKRLHYIWVRFLVFQPWNTQVRRTA